MYGLYVLNPSGSFSFAIEKVVTNTSAEKSAKRRGEEDAAATASGEAATDADAFENARANLRSIRGTRCRLAQTRTRTERRGTKTRVACVARVEGSDPERTAGRVET